jgi:hypothetical protein
VAGTTSLGASLPPCDGLVVNPYTAMYGFPAGAFCYFDSDCVSAHCNGELGGICDPF